MKRTLLLASLVVALVPAAAGADQTVRGKPQLKLSRGTPLILRGAHFSPGERVRVVVAARVRTTKRVSANQSGGFVARFPEVFVDRCNGFSAVAVGTQGSRAALKSPFVYCPPRL